ncbi:MAG: hypothetical protein WCI51_02160 [Lentisphaerota bacterium]
MSEEKKSELEELLLKIRSNGNVQQLYIDVMRDGFVIGVIKQASGVGTETIEFKSQSGTDAARSLYNKIINKADGTDGSINKRTEGDGNE